MKNLFLLFFVFLMTLSANAEEKSLDYSANGKKYNVTIVEDSVSIYVSAGKRSTSEPYFILKGKKQIDSFKESLQKMKETYIEYKSDPKRGTGENSIDDLCVNFDEFIIGWKSQSGTLIFGRGGNKNFAATYSVLNDGNNKVFEARYSGMAMADTRNRLKCFLIFISEDEIQSLIDTLPVLEKESVKEESIKKEPEELSTSKERLPGESQARYIERMAKLGYGFK